MSGGAGSPRCRAWWGGDVAEAPPGASWRVSFSVTQMKGTGLVVCRCAGRRWRGSIMVSALP